MTAMTWTLLTIFAWAGIGLGAGLGYGWLLEQGIAHALRRSSGTWLLALAPLRVALAVAVLFAAAYFSGLPGVLVAGTCFAVGSGAVSRRIREG